MLEDYTANAKGNEGGQQSAFYVRQNDKGEMRKRRRINHEFNESHE